MRRYFLSILLFISFSAMAQTNFLKEWQKADSLLNLQQPKSVLKIVNNIYAKANKSNNYEQILKSIIYKTTILNNYEEDNIKKSIDQIKEEIKIAKAPAKQVLYSMLAEKYSNYYQENYWQINRRSITKDKISEDIDTWDKEKLIFEALKNYKLSLTETDLLKRTDLKNYDEILIKEKNAKLYRPTLYDFLAHRALDYYKNERANLTLPAFVFIIDKADYFAQAETFVNINLPDADTISFDREALLLYQELIKFHLNDASPLALVDVDLSRLDFVKNKSVVAKKEKLYIDALRERYKKYENHDVAAEIGFALALSFKENEITNTYNYDEEESEEERGEENDDKNNYASNKEAVEICNAIMEKYPKTRGAANCKSLLSEITAPSMSLKTDYASAADKPALALVTYKNIPAVYFKLYLTTPEKLKALKEKNADALKNFFLKSKPVKSWEQTLPNEKDYKTHKAEVKIPELEKGLYVVLSSNEKNFSEKAQLLNANTFWKTNLSYLINNGNENNKNEIFVADRTNGEGKANVRISFFRENYNSPERNKTYECKTDKNGFSTLTFPLDDDYGRFSFLLEDGKDKFYSEEYFYNSNRKYDEQTVEQTSFFTDRAIYRPGQQIMFKGIVLSRKGDKFEIKKNAPAEVTFYDANGQKISSLKLVTNEYGSYTGSFTAPQGVLTGNMNISSASGHHRIRVEEYKRPMFEVTFEPVKGSYKLNENVTVKGKAIAYSGAVLSDAKVKYRVVRTARFPYWGWYWWRPMPSSPEMEITNGETTTDGTGTFTIDFKAIPDLKIKKENNPEFNYAMYADVTDINGETHSNTYSVTVGYTALKINTNLQAEVNLDKTTDFTLSTTNINGEKQPASGTLKITKLKKPEVLFDKKWEKPDTFILSKEDFKKDFPNEIYNNENDIETWSAEKVILNKTFNTPADSIIKLDNMNEGIYKVEIATKDKYGENVVSNMFLTAYRAKNKKGVEFIKPLFTSIINDNVEPGETTNILIGSSAQNMNIIYEVSLKNKIISRENITLNNEQKILSIPIREDYRGNIGVSFTCVHANRAFMDNKIVEVPFTNKKLDITFSTFRSKLYPGQKEEWLLTIKDKKGDKMAAELLAGMYDASLDVFEKNIWDFNLYKASYNNSIWDKRRNFGVENSEYLNVFNYDASFINQLYDQLLDKNNIYDGAFRRFGNSRKVKFVVPVVTQENVFTQDEIAKVTVSGDIEVDKVLATAAYGIERKSNSLAVVTKQKKEISETPQQEEQSVSTPQIRKNLNETAFFYPQLSTNEKGEVVIKFTMPEALTRWKFMGLAHTQDLKTGQIGKDVVTQKDLMVFPNMPRFLREGDQMKLAAKISNLSDKDLAGNAELQLFDAVSMKPINNLMGIAKTSIPFNVKKRENTSVEWEIKVPEKLEAVVYRIVAQSGNFSDGQEAPIPVLTNRMLVTETMPLPVKGLQEKTFTFDKLLQSGTASSTLRNYRVTLEYTSNPAWYAVQALPYLMEFPYECAEQTFTRYYANTLATYIAYSDPKIKQVFESWKNTSSDALQSNLEKNEELKSILIQESPWVREAKNETERKNRIGVLFDINRMSIELTSALKKLREMQSGDGGFPWFKGMYPSRYITQHIVAGMGHLTDLNVMQLTNVGNENYNMVKRAVDFIDRKVKEDFESMKKQDKEKSYLKSDRLSYDIVHYLYARTYFLSNFPLSKEYSEMIDYYKTQTIKYWNAENKNNYMKGMMALYMNRFKDKETPALIMRSLKETALHSDEMGMYWKQTNGWYWYQAPIETQALLIEAFDKVSNDKEAVDEMKVWLLKQKQTQDWKTTKATSEAIYALLLRGTDLLGTTGKLVDITVGKEKVAPYKTDTKQPEAGTGYFKTSWDAASVKPEMGNITVKNPNANIAWGSMYWQYFEQLDKITPAETPFKINKKLFKEINTAKGVVIEPLTDNNIKVGDKIVVRVEIMADRNMEYIHLKDMRASAFEPVNILSSYKWQDGLGYYEATKDASTNFFIDYMPKGTYVFEYKLVATQKGDFSNGITSIQCMYAPEFSAHSEGVRVKIQ